MVAIRRKIGIPLPSPPPSPSPPPPSSPLPPPLPTAAESPPIDFGDSVISRRLYDWRRQSRWNKIAIVTVVAIFVALLLTIGVCAFLRPGDDSVVIPTANGEAVRQSTSSTGWFLSAKQRAVLTWLDANIADPDYEVIEWSPLIGKEHQAQAQHLVALATMHRHFGPTFGQPTSPFLYVKIRHQSALGGYILTIRVVDFRKGSNEISSVSDTGSVWPDHFWDKDGR